MIMSANNEFRFTDSRLLFLVGTLAAIRVAKSLIWSFIYFWKTHIKIRLSSNQDLKKFGKWAVITGCTSGIGEHYVHELASLGLNIVLVSRSEEKLKTQASETERNYGVKTKIIACDFLDRNVHSIVAKQTEGMDIGILINNVGLNTDTGSRRYEEMSVGEVRNMIVVNSGACTSMTHVFLPGMLSRGRGCVLNVGSSSGYISLPYQALYCATKSYMRLWSLALDDEVKAAGVTVRCNIPQFIRTGMCKGNNIIYNFPIWTCEPRTYAHNTMLTLDTPDTGGWWIFDFMIWFVKAVHSVLNKDMEAHIIYHVTNCILPYSSKVSK